MTTRKVRREASRSTTWRDLVEIACLFLVLGAFVHQVSTSHRSASTSRPAGRAVAATAGLA